MKFLSVDLENKKAQVEIKGEVVTLNIRFVYEREDDSTLASTECVLAVKNATGEKLHCAEIWYNNEKPTGVNWSGKAGNGIGWSKNDFTVLGLAKDFPLEKFARNSKQAAKMAGAK